MFIGLRFTGLLLFVTVSSAALAQILTPPVEILPAGPTALDDIHGRILFTGYCQITPATIISGTTVRTTLTIDNCAGGPPPLPTNHYFRIGFVPAGTYTFELYRVLVGGPPELITQQPLVVAVPPANVPTTSTLGLVLLAGVLALAGMRVIRG